MTNSDKLTVRKYRADASRRVRVRDHQHRMVGAKEITSMSWKFGDALLRHVTAHPRFTEPGES